MRDTPSGVVGINEIPSKGSNQSTIPSSHLDFTDDVYVPVVTDTFHNVEPTLETGFEIDRLQSYRELLMKDDVDPFIRDAIHVAYKTAISDTENATYAETTIDDLQRSNINVLEEDTNTNGQQILEEATNTNGQQNQSPPSDEQTIPSIDASFQPLLEHPNEYVKGEATNGMPFTITLNEKGQVLNDEGGRTWRDILHREALRLFGPTITKDFRRQDKSKKDELLSLMHKVSAIVPPKQILRSVAEYIKNTRNALRGELVRNKNVVKPHFIGEGEWKRLLDEVAIKKKRKNGTLVGKDKYAHTVRASRLSTRHRLGKGGMLSAEAKFLQVFNTKMSEDDKDFASCYGVSALIHQKIKDGFQPVIDYEVTDQHDEREDEAEL